MTTATLTNMQEGIRSRECELEDLDARLAGLEADRGEAVVQGDTHLLISLHEKIREARGKRQELLAVLADLRQDERSIRQSVEVAQARQDLQALKQRIPAKVERAEEIKDELLATVRKSALLMKAYQEFDADLRSEFWEERRLSSLLEEPQFHITQISWGSLSIGRVKLRDIIHALSWEIGGPSRNRVAGVISLMELSPNEE